MKKVKYILIIAVSLLFCVSVEAQRQPVNTRNDNRANPPSSSQRASSGTQRQGNAPSRDRVQYFKNYMKQQGDSLVIDMDIDMTSMNLGVNRGYILTPVITSESEEIELPRVMIQGTARNKAFIRELELNDVAYYEYESNLPYAIVKPKGRLNYTFAVPFEPWMTEANLDIEEDLCGCGDQTKMARVRVFDALTKDVIAEPVYRVRPYLAYIQPEVEEIKNRQEIGNAYLDFPRGKNEILPNFGNNPLELAKIDKMIRTIATNQDITVHRVYMVGFASPESSLKFNTDLSRARSESMMKYFMNNSTIPSHMFETRTGGEDWEGFRMLLEEMPIPDKSEIIYLMNTVKDLDAREKAISKVGGGRPYKIIYDEIYPKLRRVVCEVHYTVKDFSLEEAKENMAYAPHLLSLNEMYIVANTYEVGSPEFIKVFEVAREEFPNDPVANLNGAAAALAKNNVRDAERYLRLSDPSTPEYANNMGVLLMLRGNYSESERFLKRAESIGLPEAAGNLRELSKKAANAANRREAGVDENSDAPLRDDNSSARRRVQ